MLLLSTTTETDLGELAVYAREDQLAVDLSGLVHSGVGRRQHGVELLISAQADDLVGHLALGHLALGLLAPPPLPPEIQDPGPGNEGVPRLQSITPPPDFYDHIS